MKKILLAALMLCSVGFACVPKQNIIYPSITNFIGSTDFSKYERIAVLPFVDAPSAPQSGQIIQGLTSQQLSKAGFSVVERARLFEILKEQSLSLTGALDTSQTMQIGRLSGAKALVVGEVGQYTTRDRKTDTTYFPLLLSGQTTYIPVQGQQWMESYVSLSLRVIDAETGQMIYSGSGQFDRGLTNPPQQLAEIILSSIIFKWVVGPGTIGIKPLLTPQGVFVQEVIRDSPAYSAGLKGNDLIAKINGKSIVNLKGLELRALFWYNPGDKAQLEIMRNGQTLLIEVVAANRDQFYQKR